MKLNLPGRSVRVHDYIREYLEGILPDRALLHGRLVDAWKGERQLPAGYAVQRIVFHLVEALGDTSRVVERGKQLIDLLSDKRFEEYLRQHGDATALDLGLTLAIRRASESRAKEIPALIASLVLHRKSYASEARNAALVFEAAAQGKITDAAELLALFEVDRDWNTLAQTLDRVGFSTRQGSGYKSLRRRHGEFLNSPLLQKALAWVRHSPAGVPAGLREKRGVRTFVTCPRSFSERRRRKARGSRAIELRGPRIWHGRDGVHRRARRSRPRCLL